MELKLIDKNTTLCVCNDITILELAECIKENKLTSLEEVLQNSTCQVGDKCESCIDEGFNNDGVNIPMVLSMVKNKKI